MDLSDGQPFGRSTHEPRPDDDVEQVRDVVMRPTGPALLRLIAEVRDGEAPSFDAYNRTYHRHNR